MKLATRLSKYVGSAKIVDFATLQSLRLTSDNSLRVTLSRLAKKGEIYNPLRGIYVSVEADPFWVATSLFPGYVTLSSALYLHHLQDEYPFTIFVGAQERRSVYLGQTEIFCFKARNYLGVEKRAYQIASVEKAICDCLLWPGHVGYPRIARALHDAKISKNEMLRISSGCDSAFFQRLGYLLSLLPKKDAEKKGLMEFCRRKVRSKIYLFGRKPGKYIAEWKLVDNVGKEVLRSWWGQ